MVTKKLYAQGVFVCEYESTGDDAKDIGVTRAILKERGLHRESTAGQAIYSQAHSFATVAAKIYKEDLTGTPVRNGRLLPPFVVNSAFSIELYLKALAKLHGATLRGHDLAKLFDALPETARAVIKQMQPQSATKWNISTEIDLRQVLFALKDAFVHWRYSFEHERLGTLHIREKAYPLASIHTIS
jgi:hypothetical protein